VYSTPFIFEKRLNIASMRFQLDCLDGVTGEGGKIVTQSSEWFRRSPILE
jgi:hypothetical protein